MRLTFPALAQVATPTAAPTIVEQLLQMLPMFVLIVVIFYFVIYRPQKQQRDKHKAMLSDRDEYRQRDGHPSSIRKCQDQSHAGAHRAAAWRRK